MFAQFHQFGEHARSVSETDVSETSDGPKVQLGGCVDEYGENAALRTGDHSLDGMHEVHG